MRLNRDSERTENRHSSFTSLDEIISPLSRRFIIADNQLTAGKTQVATYTQTGKTTDAIADLMGASTSTVDFHRPISAVCSGCPINGSIGSLITERQKDTGIPPVFPSCLSRLVVVHPFDYILNTEIDSPLVVTLCVRPQRRDSNPRP